MGWRQRRRHVQSPRMSVMDAPKAKIVRASQVGSIGEVEVWVTPKPAETSHEHDAPVHDSPGLPDRRGLPTPRAYGRGEAAQPLEEGGYPGRLAVVLE